MSKGKTNSGTGGSSKSSIIVTAPTGSTVYIENQAGKRKDTGEKNGVWTFKNCDIGTWTVYASQGTDSATATVEITEEGQLMRYYVDILYLRELYIFKEGEGSKVNLIPSHQANGTVSIGADSISTGFSATTGTNSAIITSEKIDITTYSTIIFDAEFFAGLVDFFIICDDVYWTAEDGVGNRDALLRIQSVANRTYYTLDIDNLSGERYIGFRGTANAKIYNIYMA